MSQLSSNLVRGPFDVTKLPPEFQIYPPPRPLGHLFEFYYQVESYLRLTVAPWQPSRAQAKIDVGDEFELVFTVTNDAPISVPNWLPHQGGSPWPRVIFKSIKLEVSNSKFATVVDGPIFDVPALRAGQSFPVRVRMKAKAAHADINSAGEQVARAMVRANFDFDSYSEVRSNRVVASEDVFPA